MPYSYAEIKSFQGLFLQPNTFAVPDGALEIASNSVIAQDGVISKRRGFYTFNTPASGTINNLFLYQSNLLALINSRIDRISSTGVATALTGETVSVTAPKVGRAAEQNSNLYFTSDNGVMKLTAYNSAVSKSGIPPALDLRGDVKLFSSGNFLANNNQVGYRVIFGIKDSNLNTILGAPSDFLYITNTSGGDRGTRLEFSIPSEITSTDVFYQIYRTSDTSSEPLPDYRLIKEANLTSAELSADVVYYDDNNLDIFRDEAEELYTNPNSREGELQANERAPLCDDIAIFKDRVFYANCVSKHFIQVNLIAPTALANNDWVEASQAPTTRRYVFRTGVGNTTKNATSAGTTTITGTYANHGLSSGDVIYVSNTSGGTDVTQGEYTLSGVTVNTFTFTANTGANPTTFDFQGLRTSGGYYIASLDITSSTAVQLDTTARGLVKAINRDPSSPIYARYLSSSSDVPGQVLLQSKTFDSDAIQLRAITTAAGTAFDPSLPNAFSTSVQSENANLPNVIYYSKIKEPEAVPVVNQIVVGSKNKEILRIFALRDSLLVLKEDGVYRVDGDNATNFQATIIDNTVFCISDSSAALLNNQVYFLSNQGICAASATSVEIISRNIELPIKAIIGSSYITSTTSGVGYESERLYLLTTILPGDSVASVVYVYNTVTSSWTTWDTFFAQSIVGPSDKLFMVSSNVIKKERKEQNKLDYTGESYSTTVNSVAAGSMTAVITSISTVPETGDIFELNGSISRINTSTALGANQYSVSFETQTTLIAGNTPSIYKKYTSIIRTSPFHGGDVGRSKQFSQMQIHTRDKSISTMDISFSTDTFGSSEVATWKAVNVASGDGWGELPWGLFAWGLEDAVNLTYNTSPAPIIRIYIPLFSQRSTFIQPYLEHKMAAEPMNIQSINFAVRGYGERVTR